MDTKEGKVSHVWEKFSWAVDVEELVRLQQEAFGPQGTEQGDTAGIENCVVVGMRGYIGITV